MAKKGQHNSPKTEFKKGHKTWNKGKKTWGKDSLTNKQHPSWIDGRTSYTIKLRNSNEYKQWRSQVYERDNWTCQTCGKRGSITLNAHHIIPFAQLLKTEFEYLIFDVSNGVTLCEECHNLTKKGAGK